MDIYAVAVLGTSDWRWRIVDYAGATLEESPVTFSAIGEAIAAGLVRLRDRTIREAAESRRAASPRR